MRTTNSKVLQSHLNTITLLQVIHPWFAVFSFSAKGAESTTRLPRWSEAASDQSSCFPRGLNPDWMWNYDLLPHLDCRPFRPIRLLLQHPCIPLWLLYWITTAVPQSLVCFFTGKHCTKRVFLFFLIRKWNVSKRRVVCFWMPFSCDTCN